MNNVTSINKSKKAKKAERKSVSSDWSHVCPGIGLITMHANNVQCKCGATKFDQDGVA